MSAVPHNAQIKQQHIFTQLGSDEPLLNQDREEPMSRVIRNSNSHEDSMLLKLYQTQSKPNDTLSMSKAVKNQRELKKQLNLASEEDGQFIAYCVVLKQNSSGIYYNQRLLVLHSKTKQLKYYSKIPKLPISSSSSLDEPKDVVNIGSNNKFTITQGKRGIGEVLVSYISDGELKEWKLRMSSNAVAKQFIILTGKVRRNQHMQTQQLDKKQLLQKLQKMAGKSSLSPNKVNSSVTPFMEQLQQLQKKNQNRKSQIKQKQDRKNNYEKIDNSQLKLQVSQVGHINYPNEVEDKRKQQNTVINLDQPQQTEELIKQSKPSVSIIPLDTSLGWAIQINTLPPLNHQTSKKYIQNQKQQQPKFKQSQQINIQQIINTAQSRRDTVEQIITPKSAESNRMSQIDRILKVRRQLPEQPSSSTLINQKINNITTSKILFKQLERKNTNRDQTKNIIDSLQPSRNQHIQSIRIQDIIQQAENTVKQDQVKHYQTTPYTQKHRQSLLAERQQTQGNPPIRRSTVIHQHSHPRTERSSSKYKTYTIKNKNQEPSTWLDLWLEACQSNSQHKMMNVYDQFIDYCKRRVIKLTEGFLNWHLFHRQAQQYELIEGDLCMNYVMLKDKETQQQEHQMRMSFNNQQFIWQLAHKHNKLENNYKLLTGLSCIVSYQGLNVFCRTNVSSVKLVLQTINQSNLQYLHELQLQSRLSMIQNRVRLVKRKSQDKIKWLYFDQADILPFLPYNQSTYIDHHYINTYINSGIITNEQEMIQIKEHIDSTVMPALLRQIQNSKIVSLSQMMQSIQQFGLNTSFLPQLLEKSQQLGFIKSSKYICSQLWTMVLEEFVCEHIHSFLLTKNKSQFNMQKKFSRIISSALKWDTQSMNMLLQKMKTRTIVQFVQLREWIVDELVVSSLLTKLGIRCDLMLAVNLQELQQRHSNFWSECDLSEDIIELNLVVTTAICDCNLIHPHFQFLQQHVINQPTGSLAQNIILSKINHNPLREYSQSYLFKLLSVTAQFTVNQHLAAAGPPSPSSFSYSQQTHNPYFYYTHHPTCYFLSYSCFNTHLMAVRWLIRQHHYSIAHQKLNQLMLRAWIWSSSQPYILLSLYDIQAILGLLLFDEAYSLSSSLKSLRLSIYFFELGMLRQEKQVWDKTYKCANIHSKLKRYEKAVELYATCQLLLQQPKELNQDYCQCFFRQLEGLLVLGKFKEVVQKGRDHILKYQNWKKDRTKQQIDIICQCQFQTYLLMIRSEICLSDQTEIIKLCDQCYGNLICPLLEGTINSITIVQDRISALLKYLWPTLLLSTLTSSQLHTLNQLLRVISNQRQIINYQSALSYLISQLFQQQQKKCYRPLAQWLLSYLKSINWSHEYQVYKLRECRQSPEMYQLLALNELVGSQLVLGCVATALGDWSYQL